MAKTKAKKPLSLSQASIPYVNCAKVDLYTSSLGFAGFSVTSPDRLCRLLKKKTSERTIQRPNSWT
jgi:hypothetical protein